MIFKAGMYIKMIFKAGMYDHIHNKVNIYVSHFNKSEYIINVLHACLHTKAHASIIMYNHTLFHIKGSRSIRIILHSFL